MHSGQCLCGAVKYEIDGELAGIQLCHCAMCRSAQGGAFATNLPVETRNFRIVAGEASLKTYESSPGKQRLFCSECGSPIISRLIADPSKVRVRIGTLSEPVATRPIFHFNVASQASWWAIADDLPQYPGDKPG
jgi:hypothetical protein